MWYLLTCPLVDQTLDWSTEVLLIDTRSLSEALRRDDRPLARWTLPKMSVFTFVWCSRKQSVESDS